jgi:hypothetical protein
MSENFADALLAPVQKIAQEVVRSELRSFRGQLEELCLQVVSVAIDRLLGSDAFRERVREAAGGAAAADDVGQAVSAYMAEHGGKLLQSKGIQIELNSLVLEKAKELFKRSALGGSLDMKKIVVSLVERALADRAPVPAAAKAEDVKAIVSQCLREGLGSGLSETIRNEVRSFLASDELKELLDSKFRAIDLYLKTELIPKIVKREISMAMESR